MASICATPGAHCRDSQVELDACTATVTLKQKMAELGQCVLLLSMHNARNTRNRVVTRAQSSPVENAFCFIFVPSVLFLTLCSIYQSIYLISSKQQFVLAWPKI